MVRVSFGPNGEFFLESSDALSKEEMDTVEELYKRILTARAECLIVSQVMKDSEEE